jgi:hypothetical protein
MKRSEILNLIEGLFELAPKYPNDLNAENLLSNLEQLGMLPPKIFRKDPGHFLGDEFEYDVNEWEPE